MDKWFHPALHCACNYPSMLVSELIHGSKGKVHRWQNSWGQHGAHLGPVGPGWAPCWPHAGGPWFSDLGLIDPVAAKWPWRKTKPKKHHSTIKRQTIFLYILQNLYWYWYFKYRLQVDNKIMVCYEALNSFAYGRSWCYFRNANFNLFYLSEHSDFLMIMPSSEC